MKDFWTPFYFFSTSVSFPDLICCLYCESFYTWPSCSARTYPSGGLPSLCFTFHSHASILDLQVSYTIGWTAISSLLGTYKLQYGPQILLQMNSAYFLPSIPVLLLQTQWDDFFNRKFGLAKATTFRLIFGAVFLSQLYSNSR